MNVCAGNLLSYGFCIHYHHYSKVKKAISLKMKYITQTPNELKDMDSNNTDTISAIKVHAVKV